MTIVGAARHLVSGILTTGFQGHIWLIKQFKVLSRGRSIIRLVPFIQPIFITDSLSVLYDVTP